MRTFLVPPVVGECKEPSVRKSPKGVKLIIYYIRRPFIITSCRSSATVSELLSEFRDSNLTFSSGAAEAYVTLHYQMSAKLT